MILKILRFRGRSFIILLKVDLLFVRPYLYAEIWQKLLNFCIIFTLADCWVAQIKIYIDRGVYYIYVIIIYAEHLTITKISTYNPKSVPRMEESCIIFIVTEIILSAPLNRYSSSWRIWSIIKVKILLLVIYIHILKNRADICIYINHCSVQPCKE